MVLLSLCVVCSLFGIVVIHSATLTYNNPNKFVFVQVLSLLLGIAAFIVLTVIDADIIADKWMYLCIFDVLFLLILIPLGYDGGTGNKSWLRFFGIGIQPSEVVKIVFIIILAKQISYLKEYKNLNSGWSVLQLVVHFVLLFGLIVGISSDLGSALIIMFIFIVMVFAAGIKWYWIGIGFAAAAAVIPFAWSHLLKPYQKARILAPYDPQSVDPTGDNITWQANQSKMALASGKLTGMMKSDSKVNYGVASIPTNNGTTPVALGVCDRLMVFKDKEAADQDARNAAISKFFDYFYNVDNYSKYMEPMPRPMPKSSWSPRLV